MDFLNVSFTSKILLALVAIGIVAGDFTYPPAGRVRLTVGDTHTIRYETELEEYSIALWQQQKDGESVSLGPTILETRKGAGEKAFEWDVNTYNLDLEDSGPFFFWIFEGPRSNQGDQSKRSVSSALFEIQGADGDNENDSRNTRIDPKLMLSSSSSLLLVSKAFTTDKASATDDSQPSTPTKSSSKPSNPPGTQASPTTDLGANGVGTLKAEPSESSGSAISDSSDSDGQTPNSSTSSLSMATKIGVGVGASIGGVAMIVGLALLIAKYGKTGRSRARSAMATSVLFWCRGRESSQSAAGGSHKSDFYAGRHSDVRAFLKAVLDGAHGSRTWYQHIEETEPALCMTPLYDSETSSSLDSGCEDDDLTSTTDDGWSRIDQSDLTECVHCSGVEIRKMEK